LIRLGMGVEASGDVGRLLELKGDYKKRVVEKMMGCGRSEWELGEKEVYGILLEMVRKVTGDSFRSY
jgi:hypothetical protein